MKFETVEPEGVMIWTGAPLERTKTIAHLETYDLSNLVESDDYEYLYAKSDIEQIIQSKLLDFLNYASVNWEDFTEEELVRDFLEEESR